MPILQTMGNPLVTDLSSFGFRKKQRDREDMGYFFQKENLSSNLILRWCGKLNLLC